MAFELRRRGKTIPYTDMIIATAALQANVLLLHADEHYNHIVSATALIAESLISLIQKGNGRKLKR